MKQIYTELQKLNVKEPKSSNRVQENLFLIIKRKYYKTIQLGRKLRESDQYV